MMPARLALYAFFALRKKDCKKEVLSCRGCTDCYQSVQDVLDQQEKVAELYRKLAGNRDFFAMSDSGILSLGKENFNSYRSKIRKDIERGFGMYALREIAIASVGRRPDTCYGLKIDRERIRIVF